MSDTSSEENLHPTSLLLPWYVAGTLPEEERQEVDVHLSECRECRQELEDMRQLREGVHAHFSTLPDPSPRVFDRVKTRILEEDILQQSSEESPIQSMWSRWVTVVEEGFRALFIPRWAPGLAMAVIAAQATLLFWSLTTPPGELSDSRAPMIMERSGTQTTPESKAVLAQIAFREEATEQDLRDVMQTLEARIVNGPSVDGIYIVEFLEKNPAVVDKKLQTVLSQRSSVRLAKRITPQ